MPKRRRCCCWSENNYYIIWKILYLIQCGMYCNGYLHHTTEVHLKRSWIYHGWTKHYEKSIIYRIFNYFSIMLYLSLFQVKNSSKSHKSQELATTSVVLRRLSQQPGMMGWSSSCCGFVAVGAWILKKSFMYCVETDMTPKILYALRDRYESIPRLHLPNLVIHILDIYL